MKKLVIYHGGGCADGWASAWLMKRAHPDAELHAANYGDEPPDVRDREVYIVDFSWPRSQMLRIVEQCKGNLTVLDHHKTAQKELELFCEECYSTNATGQQPPLDRIPTVTFDMKKSGAMLTWDFLAKSHNVVPWVVQYVQDRDLWEWKLPMSKEINANLRSYPQTMEAWNSLLERDPAVFAVEGAAILRDQAVTIATHVKNAWEIELAGHKVLCVNATTLISEIAGELASGMPFGCSFFDKGNGQRIWSLRSREGGIDVSEIAKQFGGGGHKAAAGFQEKLK